MSTKTATKKKTSIVEKLISALPETQLEITERTNQPTIIGEDSNTCPVAQREVMETLDIFPTLLFKINKPEFLADVRKVANANLKKMKKRNGNKIDDIYPVVMSEHLDGIPEMMPFANYVAQTAWNILDEQGYDVMPYRTYFTELWCQEHHKHSLMEEHVHPYGVHIVGMYFTEVPDHSPRLIVHDPRPAKSILNLPQKDQTMLTPGSVMVNFEPKEGDLFFAPAWLAHSFGRHAGNKPFKFIHFNLGLVPAGNYIPPTQDPNSPTTPNAVNTSAPEII